MKYTTVAGIVIIVFAVGMALGTIGKGLTQVEVPHTLACVGEDGKPFFKAEVTDVRWLTSTRVAFKTKLSSAELYVPTATCVDEVVDPVAAAAANAVVAAQTPPPAAPPTQIADAGPTPATEAPKTEVPKK